MKGGLPEIIRCPPGLVTEALSLVLTDLAPSQRQLVAASLLNADDSADLCHEPLFVALVEGRIYGAAWGQKQAGNVAVFWPPRMAGADNFNLSVRLAEAVVRSLDATAVEMTQALVEPPGPELTSILVRVGFRWIAELLYLTCEAARFPRQQPAACGLEYTQYDDSQRARLRKLIERSYEGTLDCAALDGVRDVDNVITGYQATGVYRPENWLIVSEAGTDIGAILVADHPKAGHWELMYMGILPEARGHGHGARITQHVQWLANRAGVERIVLAVDAVNQPALGMYRRIGFEIWDRRMVYVRFSPKSRG